MRMSRRAVLHGIGGVDYSYTGTYDSYGNASQGFLVLKTSGTLTIKGTVDLCLVGGGGRGSNATSTYGGGGGAGGYIQNYFAQELNGNFTVTIGEGSSTQNVAGGQTKIGTTYAANGGNSATGQSGASGGGAAGAGATSTNNGTGGVIATRPFNDYANFVDYPISAGGGGGGYRISSSSLKTAGAGGAGGGGAGGTASSTANVNGSDAYNQGGSGGGGGGQYSSTTLGTGGKGASGVVFICWGYTH